MVRLDPEFTVVSHRVRRFALDRDEQEHSASGCPDLDPVSHDVVGRSVRGWIQVVTAISITQKEIGAFISWRVVNVIAVVGDVSTMNIDVIIDASSFPCAMRPHVEWPDMALHWAGCPASNDGKGRLQGVSSVHGSTSYVGFLLRSALSSHATVKLIKCGRD